MTAAVEYFVRHLDGEFVALEGRAAEAVIAMRDAHEAEIRTLSAKASEARSVRLECLRLSAACMANSEFQRLGIEHAQRLAAFVLGTGQPTA